MTAHVGRHLEEDDDDDDDDDADADGGGGGGGDDDDDDDDDACRRHLKEIPNLDLASSHMLPKEWRSTPWFLHCRIDSFHPGLAENRCDP